MGKKKTGAGRELVIAEKDVIPELLSGVSNYLGKKRGELSRAFEHLETWDVYLRGYESGILAGLKIAEDMVQCMSDRVMAAENPWPSEPYPLRT
jgi:hypothetical protein